MTLSMTDTSEKPWPGIDRNDVLQATVDFKPFGSRDMSKYLWTVKIDDKIYPARQLVLRAKGLYPNATLNSYHAIDILRKLNFDVYYKGTKQ